tara:strand:- start:5353 stop:6183 length:831 start_codon:yes stop_codon:yes gene_type:complete
MSVNGKYVKIARILERVHSDWGFDSIPIEDAIEWAGSLFSLAPSMYVLKHDIAEITIAEGKGKLPCNLESIIQTAKLQNDNTLVANVPPTLFFTPEELLLNDIDSTSTNILITNLNSKTLLPMRWATNTFHLLHHKTDIDFQSESAITYIVNDNYIFTNFETGTVYMSYLAIPIDEDGLPMIPDNESWIRAASHEIAWMWSKKEAIKGNIGWDTVQYIERDRDWYFAQAVNRSRMNSIDKEEGSKNHRLDAFRTGSQHNSMFRNMQLPGSFKTERN